MKYILFGLNMATKMLLENGLKNLLFALVSTKWRHLPEGNYGVILPALLAV